MSYKIDDYIGSRFRVIGLCSDSGGMGQVLHVEDSIGQFPNPLVLKYCREKDQEYILRFSREVRLLETFRGNPLVVHVYHSDVNNFPPYFVMPLYADGDLANIVPLNPYDIQNQEIIFNQMLDCINVLHSRGVFHRDIKPQNFLINNGSLAVSDFGLGMEPGSLTRFTTVGFWGTEGYLPPEFQRGGFRNADASGDIYMLGKSFYALLTNSNPAYLINNGLIHPALFYVIEKCCELDKIKRYQSLAELKHALKLAFDIVLNRGGEIGGILQSLAKIENKIGNGGSYNKEEIKSLLAQLPLLDEEDKITICTNISQNFFLVIADYELYEQVGDFLKIYSIMVEDQRYDYGFSEVIARNMSILFYSNYLSHGFKAKSLELAIDAAVAKNRFAAMDICENMISSIRDDNFGSYVAAVIQKNKNTFLSEIDRSRCGCNSIRNALAAIAKINQ